MLDVDDTEVARWKTRYLVTEPLDDFVLTTDARIAFDLRTHINGEPTLEKRWIIDMPSGKCRARFRYHVDDKREWYDFLAKRSRFAQLTPPWNGTIESNTIEFVNNIPRNAG